MPLADMLGKAPVRPEEAEETDGGLTVAAEDFLAAVKAGDASGVAMAFRAMQAIVAGEE